MSEPRGKRKHVYDYPRPMVTVDMAVLTPMDDQLRVLLIRRGHDPYRGCWALPGGFVEIDEPLEDAARRELAEETGLRLPRSSRRSSDVWIEELRTFGAPGRDPRGRTITVAYLVLIRPGCALRIRAGDDADEAGWFNVYRLPRVAFDHRDIIQCAVARLRTDFEHRRLACRLLPRKGTLVDLQHTYELVFRQPFDRATVRRKARQLELELEEAKDRRRQGHRAAKR